MGRNKAMRTVVKTLRDHSVILRMDEEAARATFASVVFAAKYHDQIQELAESVATAMDHGQIQEIGGPPHADNLRSTR